MLDYKNVLMSYDRVGVDIPTIEVRFENLKIETEVHVGKRALPTLTNYTLDMVEVCSTV